MMKIEWNGAQPPEPWDEPPMAMEDLVDSLLEAVGSSLPPREKDDEGNGADGPPSPGGLGDVDDESVEEQDSLVDEVRAISFLCIFFPFDMVDSRSIFDETHFLSSRYFFQPTHPPTEQDDECLFGSRSPPNTVRVRRHRRRDHPVGLVNVATGGGASAFERSGGARGGGRGGAGGCSPGRHRRGVKRAKEAFGFHDYDDEHDVNESFDAGDGYEYGDDGDGEEGGGGGGVALTVVPHEVNLEGIYGNMNRAMRINIRRLSEINDRSQRRLWSLT